MPEWTPKKHAVLPKHVAIIMDGNRRWAEKRHIPKALGHKAGVEALRDIIRYSSDIGIEALTVYAFSTENWKRSTEEVGALMSLLLEYFRSELDELGKENVRIRILGDIDGMPAGTEKQQEALKKAIARTEKNSGLQLNIAINYGGRQEITNAARKLAKLAQNGMLDPESITEDMVTSMMYTAGLPEVDYIIRTSGEIRLSNFLLWQCAYAEFYITDVLWPDFSKMRFDEALSVYETRSRRFGKS